jgi:hypothetical protein
MSARTVRTALFATTFALCLACAGAIDAVAPEPPVPPPAGATPSSFNTKIDNGTSSTTIGYDTEDKPVDVFKHYKKALSDDGWSVSAERGDGAGVLTATKDGGSFVVTIEEGSFETVWTKP